MNFKKKGIALYLLFSLFTTLSSGQWTSTTTLTSHDFISKDLLLSGSSLSGSGSKLFWHDNKKAFRGGSLTAVGQGYWDTDSLGDNSLSYGIDTRALSSASISLGMRTTTRGFFGGIALGFNTESHGNSGSIAIGSDAFCAGNDGAAAIGYQVTTTGNMGAISMGRKANNSGSQGAISLGYFTDVTGDRGSMAIGSVSEVSGNDGSIAAGYYNEVTGSEGTAAIGAYNFANANNGSVVMGYESKISGSFGSLALGNNTEVTGSHGAIAMGSRTLASANNSFAFGKGVGLANFRLINNIANSMMVGFNSELPTLFVGPSLGAGTTGNVGIATTNPIEKLDINGAIRIGNSAANNTGTIRWDGNDFEGYTGSQWKSLTTDNQTLALSGNFLTITGGNAVFLPFANQIWNVNGTSAFYSAGNVGIGTANPTHKLHVNGNLAITGQIVHPSDERLKEGISPLSNALDIIESIEPKKYHYKSNYSKQFNLPTKQQYGLLAQDVEQILPELVQDKVIVAADGSEYKGLNYEQLIPILIGAIREQQNQIDNLEKSIKNK